MTVSNTRNIAGLPLVTTCTISNVSGAIETYRSGRWYGDSFDNLYNVGGVDGANTMVAGIANSTDGDLVSFDLACSATYDGSPVPLTGLVYADAEASNDYQGEYIEATAPAGTTWRILDRIRNAECTTSNSAVLTGDTMRFAPGWIECVYDFTWYGYGPAAVGFMEGATSAHISMQGGGVSAVAVGVVVDIEFGDAPASYGEAGALYQPAWTGGVVNAGTNDVFAMTLATHAAPPTRLGDLVDPDVGPYNSATASGDDADKESDEDGVSGPINISTQPGSTHTQTVACTGPGFVKGWIDWDTSGAFETDEGSDVVECTGSSVVLTWTVPADADVASTFMRLRIGLTAADAAMVTGITLNGGEVEDHAIDVDIPDAYTVSGSVAEDIDADGLPNSGLGGVTVELEDGLGATVATTTTATDGSYSFADVVAGNYTIVSTDLTGYGSVSDVDGANDNLISISVVSANVTGRDFVDEPWSSISGTVFLDADNDGD